MIRFVCAVLVLMTAGTAPRSALAQEPSLSIRFAAGKTVFQPRERIDIEIAARRGETSGVDVYEGPGGWVGVEVVLDHTTGVATPLRPLDAGFDPRWPTEPSGALQLTLNGWYRFDT